MTTMVDVIYAIRKNHTPHAKMGPRAQWMVKNWSEERAFREWAYWGTRDHVYEDETIEQKAQLLAESNTQQEFESGPDDDIY
jgi:hypothetical protein